MENLVPNLENDNRFIGLIDMDCYYAQVEMKKHGIDPSIPVGIQQWTAIIAMNYAAKGAGVNRTMNVYEALEVCPECIFVHISTVEVRPEWKLKTKK